MDSNYTSFLNTQILMYNFKSIIICYAPLSHAIAELIFRHFPVHLVALFVNAFVIVLCQTVHNRNDKVDNHQHYQIFESLGEEIFALLRRFTARSMQACLLIGEECFEWLLETFAHPREQAEHIDRLVDQRLAERNDHKDFLNVHFDNGLAEQRGPEECPEWYEEMAARDASQVEQRIWYLQMNR